MHVNNDYQRNANLSRVFETVWKNPNFSRIDIARKLELYRSTVSNIIGTLVESDLICEGERGLPTEKGECRRKRVDANLFFFPLILNFVV